MIKFSERPDIVASFPKFVLQKFENGLPIHDVLISNLTTLLQNNPRFIHANNVTWFVFALITRSLFLDAKDMKDNQNCLDDPHFTNIFSGIFKIF